MCSSQLALPVLLKANIKGGVGGAGSMGHVDSEKISMFHAAFLCPCCTSNLRNRHVAMSIYRVQKVIPFSSRSFFFFFFLDIKLQKSPIASKSLLDIPI